MSSYEEPINSEFDARLTARRTDQPNTPFTAFRRGSTMYEGVKALRIYAIKKPVYAEMVTKSFANIYSSRPPSPICGYANLETSFDKDDELYAIWIMQVKKDPQLSNRSVYFLLVIRGMRTETWKRIGMGETYQDWHYFFNNPLVSDLQLINLV